VRQTNPTQAKPPEIVVTEDQQSSFDRHFARCFLTAGDRVVFKKPKKKRIYGTVEHVETDLTKVFFSDANVPRYIRVRIDKINQSTGEIVGQDHVWVNESKVNFVPPKQE
jgi:signal peptidase I